MKLLNLVFSVAVLAGSVPSFAQFEKLSTERQTILRLKAEDTVQRLFQLHEEKRALEEYAKDRGEDMQSRAEILSGVGVVGGGLFGLMVGYFPGFKTPKLASGTAIGALVGGVLAYKLQRDSYGASYNALMEKLPEMSVEERTDLYKKVLVGIDQTEEQIAQIDALDRE